MINDLRIHVSLQYYQINNRNKIKSHKTMNIIDLGLEIDQQAIIKENDAL